MGGIAAREVALYTDVWSLPQYAKWSPGVDAIPRFRRLTGATPPTAVTDYGCGTGRAGAALAADGFVVTLVDQTDAGLEVRDLPFDARCLWAPLGHRVTSYGFCCDVLEHIPAELTALTIASMLDACDTALYLEISTVPDGCGVLVGETLHKTVQPFVWWLALCREIGTVTAAIDLQDRAALVVTR